MRTPNRVKQKMFYSLPHDGHPIYETDEEGNIVYIEVDGERVPLEVGQTPEGYDEPIEFYNSITSNLTAAELEAYGNEAQNVVKMTYPAGSLPFKVGAVVWKTSEVEYKEDGSVDETSADFRVIGVQTVGRHFHKVMLETIV